MKKILNLIKKNIFGVIIGGIIFGSVGVYAGTKFYASDVSVTAPTGSNLGSSATLQNALDDLYSKINSYTKLYPNGTVIYYNPVSGEKCSASDAVSTTGTKTGCMKWYVFNDSEGASTVNVILDHNTTARVKWNDDNKNVAYADSNIKPEVDKLVSESNWKSVPRLITAEEVNKITGKEGWTNTSSWYCFESKVQDSTSSPYCNNTGKLGWLYDHTYCKEGSNDWKCSNHDTATYGYWTSTTYGNAGSGSSVWCVDRIGDLGYDYAINASRGLRPVITISKSIIK